MTIPLNNGVSEEYFGISKEYVEDAVTNLHRRTKNDGNVLQSHLIVLLLLHTEATVTHVNTKQLHEI